MRIITVDNGNTNPHVGIFHDEKLESIIPLKNYVRQKDDFIIVSDVGAPLDFKPSFDLKSKREFKDNIYYFFEMPIQYTETLGDDRLISSYALYKQLKDDEVILLIDAGTFITMDIVSNKGFEGGFIFPGIRAFLSSYQMGSNLGVLEPKSDLRLSGLPHSTEEAILGACECYLESIVEDTIKKTSPSKIVLTGGSFMKIKTIISKLNLSTVQLETNPHLLHTSLFWIYQNHLRLKCS